MKRLFLQFPFLSRMALALALGFAAIVASGIIYKGIPLKPYFPFVGEVLLIAVTVWLSCTDKQALFPHGLSLTAKTIACLFGGLLLAVLALLAISFLRTLYTGEHWHFATAVDGAALAKSLYFILPTVMVQELMFRGYLFTKTIAKWGVARANTIFAIAFTLVHVVDRDVLQNPAQFVSLLLVIPVGHLWFATALLRSKTLLFPIGLHWGNNWAVQHLVGAVDGKDTIFYLSGGQAFTSWLPFVLMLLLFNVFFLLVTLAIWKWRWPFANKGRTATKTV
ncbi:CPBP family intramembrane metalloprotease [Flavisolibacter sp. BT320]|nr:CPBP family intramembrane metalloprotease [Flavisolibacter longurius]